MEQLNQLQFKQSVLQMVTNVPAGFVSMQVFTTAGTATYTKTKWYLTLIKVTVTGGGASGAGGETLMMIMVVEEVQWHIN